MKRPKLNQTLFLCLLFVLLAACAGPAAEAPVENAAEAPVVQAPEATSVPAEAGITHLTQPSDLPAESISQASDKSKASHNGFESLLFDAGQGNDTDLAWSRLNPNGTAGVQLAVKKSLLMSDAFLWGSWAGRSAINPALFDLSDSYTIEEAGSALADSIFYPIKELSEVDNTCRQPVGFAASGNESDSCTRPPDCPEGNWLQSDCACVYPG